MTDDTTTDTVDESAAKATTGESSHTNPHAGDAFGDDFAFTRGAAVAADGGEREAVADGDAEAADDAETMADVDHEHPNADAEGANRVFQRGNEGETDSV